MHLLEDDEDVDLTDNGYPKVAEQQQKQELQKKSITKVRIHIEGTK